MSKYYNENFGVNAVQSEFTVDNPTFDEKVDRLKRTYAAGKKFYDEQESKINKSEKDAIRSNYGSRTAWTLGGATVGAGAGYLIGRQWAKKDPVISQQRKKELVGTLSGAILGAGAGYGIKRGLERWGSDDIRKSYSDARSELSNKRATLDATYKSKMDALHKAKSDNLGSMIHEYETSHPRVTPVTGLNILGTTKLSKIDHRSTGFIRPRMTRDSISDAEKLKVDFHNLGLSLGDAAGRYKRMIESGKYSEDSSELRSARERFLQMKKLYSEHPLFTGFKTSLKVNPKYKQIDSRSLEKTRANLLFTLKTPELYGILDTIDRNYHGDENGKPLPGSGNNYHNDNYLISSYRKLRNRLKGISEFDFVATMRQGMWSTEIEVPQDAYSIASRFRRKPITSAQRRSKYNYHKRHADRLKSKLSSTWKSDMTHGFNVGSSIGTTVGMTIGGTAGGLGVTIPSLGLGTAAGTIYGSTTGAGAGYGIGGALGVSIAMAKRAANRARLKYHQHKLHSLKIKH